MNPNLAKLPQGWEQIIAKEYTEGASDVEVRAKLRMTQGVWDSLYDDMVNTQFREIVDFGRVLSKAWWMSKARENLSSRNFNGNLWLMVMKNMFGWSEKTTISTKEPSDLSHDELMSRISEVQKKLEKAHKA